MDVLTGRVSDLLAELVPIDAVPSLAEIHRRRHAARELAVGEPWVAAVLRLTETEAFKSTPWHPGWIAEILGISLETERRCLQMLTDAGVLREVAGGYRAASPLTVLARPGADLARLKHHWALQGATRALDPREGDLLSFNICSLSRADLARLRALHRRYFTELRAIVAASGPAETLVEWAPEAPPPPPC